MSVDLIGWLSISKFQSVSCIETRGGSRIPRRRVRQQILLSKFSKNCMKLRKFWAVGGKLLLMRRVKKLDLVKVVFEGIGNHFHSILFSKSPKNIFTHEVVPKQWINYFSSWAKFWEFQCNEWHAQITRNICFDVDTDRRKKLWRKLR